jgi:hypothetical protein
VRFASIVFATAALTATAAADGKDSGAELFQEGRQLSQQGKYDEACDRFAKSYELEPATGTQVNFADCQEHIGHLARAWQLFDAAAGASDREGNAVRAEYARQRANGLVARLSSLVIHVASPDPRMSIMAGARAFTPSREIRGYVDPGEVEVVASIDGKRFAKSITARAGATTSIDIPVLSAGQPDAVAPGARRRGWVIASAVLAVGGVAAISGSALLTLSASRQYADTFAGGECLHTPRGAECTAAGLERVDDARSRADLATGVFIAGVALVGGALATYMLAPRTSTIEVVPAATTDEVGVTISGRF